MKSNNYIENYRQKMDCKIKDIIPYGPVVEAFNPEK